MVQNVGAERSHYSYFISVRNPRLERYASETNKLIIRLHKLLKDMPAEPVQRKQHEQNIVPWLDGSSVKLCPNCAKSFHIARRQHHCRLCGSIMCNDCSKFLPLDDALELASLTMSRTDPIPKSKDERLNSIRTCDHCLWLLETRKEMHGSRTCRPPTPLIYDEIQQLQKNILPDIEMYLKIIDSLYSGDSIFTLADASALRGKIGQVAEMVDLKSKKILIQPCQEGSREESMKKSIRLSCVQFIKERMLSIPPLPGEVEIKKIQDKKRMETEQRIETERRLALEAYEKYGLTDGAGSGESYASGLIVKCQLLLKPKFLHYVGGEISSHFLIVISHTNRRNVKLIKELKPSVLVIPENYTKPHPIAPQLYIEQPDKKIITFKCGEIIRLPLKRKMDRVYLTCELASKIVPREITPGVTISTLTGILEVKEKLHNIAPCDDESDSKANTSAGTTLHPPKREEVLKKVKYEYGGVDIDLFIKKLAQNGITDIKTERIGGVLTISIPSEDTILKLMKTQRKQSLRLKLRDSLMKCVQQQSPHSQKPPGRVHHMQTQFTLGKKPTPLPEGTPMHPDVMRMTGNPQQRITNQQEVSTTESTVYSLSGGNTGHQ